MKKKGNCLKNDLFERSFQKVSKKIYQNVLGEGGGEEL